MLAALVGCSAAARTPRLEAAAVCHEGFVFDACFDPSGTRFVSCGRDGMLVAYAMPGGTPTATVRCNDSFTSIAFDVSGRWLCSTQAHGELALWSDFREMHRRAAHTETAYAAAFDPACRRVASCGFDGHVRVWSVPQLQCLLDIPTNTDAVFSVAFIGDDRLASGHSDGSIRLWDVNSGRPLARAPAHTAACTHVLPLRSNLIATAGWDHRVRLWRAEDLASVATLEGHEEAIDALAATPDGRALFSADWAGEIAQ